MKHALARSVSILSLLATILVACVSPPGAIATLAPTAELPDGELSFNPWATATSPVESASSATAADPTAASAETPTTGADATTAASATATAFVAIVASPTEAPTPTEPVTPTPTGPLTYTYEVINTYPHDTTAFTQGLVYHEGGLYEGTGRWGESTLREVVLETGAVLRSQPLDPQYFGEGIALLNDRIYQLTWQEQTGFVYDRATFEPLQTFSYPTEGWGITHDGQRLIVSDGTSTIYFWDPETLEEIGRMTVRDHQGPVNRLNELEYVDGEIWANIWLTDLIARISPETGDVLGYIDLTGLLDTTTLTEPVDVLNGIAYDAAGGRIFVTGKLWPSLFEIAVIPES